MSIQPIHLIYLLTFITLSGYHVTFLNPESILALCFFIFFSLIINNSGGLVETLTEYRQAINSQLIELGLNGLKKSITISIEIIDIKTALLLDIKNKIILSK